MFRNDPKFVNNVQIFQDWVTREWGRCSDLRGAFENHAITYLLSVNGGGAAAVIAFSGSASYATSDVYWSLSFFLLGLVSTGVGIAAALYKMSWITRELNLDHHRFNENQLDSDALEKNHNQRFNKNVYGVIAGWIAFICFILGTFMSIYTYNNFVTAKAELTKRNEARIQQRSATPVKQACIMITTPLNR